MTIFRFTSADGLTNVEFTTDLIGYAAGSDNLTVCQVVDNSDTIAALGNDAPDAYVPNATTQSLLNAFQNGQKYSKSLDLVAYAVTNSLTLTAHELGRETEAAGETSANAATLAAPTGFLGTVNSATQITLNWTKSAGATGYSIDRATAVDFSTGLVNTIVGDVALKVVTGLTTGTHYWFRIKAQKAGFTDSAYALDNKTTS